MDMHLGISCFLLSLNLYFYFVQDEIQSSSSGSSSEILLLGKGYRQLLLKAHTR